jgi:hypothetical protein
VEPCREKSRKVKEPSGQKSSKAEDTAEQRTVRSRLHTGSKMPGRERKPAQALGSKVPAAGPATYRWWVEVCNVQKSAGWRPELVVPGGH